MKLNFNDYFTIGANHKLVIQRDSSRKCMGIKIISNDEYFGIELSETLP